MKRLSNGISVLLAALMILQGMAIPALAVSGAGFSDVAIEADVDEQEITITGTVPSGTARQLTVTLKSGAEVRYLNQFESGTDGAFTHVIPTAFSNGQTFALTLGGASQRALETSFTVGGGSGGGDSGDSGGGGGGGGSTTNKPETGKNEDGSTTQTVTDPKTGAVTETTTWPDGKKLVEVTEKDGSRTSTQTLKDGTRTETVTTRNGETTATVTLPKGTGEAKVSIPVDKTGPGTVAVLVKEDGTEEILKDSVALDGSLIVTVPDGARLKIVDNSKSFGDVPAGQWFADAVAFATSHELFQGTGDDTFSPNLPMTRAMLVTVLHRFANTPAGGSNAFPDVAGGQWYTEAVAWAHKSGIVQGTENGFDPDGNITRESLAVILYRYAKGTAGTDRIGSYADAGSVSDWAREAMNWAVSHGYITGKDGSRLDPAGNATRAEVATILMRFIQDQAAGGKNT